VIANEFALAVNASTTGRLTAVGSRTEVTARTFADKHGVARAHGSYDDVLSDAEVDAVYVATPHTGHLEWTLRAAGAGKHLLVEKPIGINSAEAAQMLSAASAHDVFLMEAFMYRCHPQTHAIVALIEDGAIGDLRSMHASFGFAAPFDPASRLFNPALGGGGILDVGCYPASMAVLIAAASGASLDAPLVTGGGRLGPTGVDEWASATAVFDNGLVAELSTGVSVELDSAVRIFGTTGRITIPRPWGPARTSEIILSRQGAADEVRTISASAHVFTLEVETVARHLHNQQAPAMPWSHTTTTMSVLDAWRRAVGVSYPGEAPPPQSMKANE